MTKPPPGVRIGRVDSERADAGQERRRRFELYRTSGEAPAADVNTVLRQSLKLLHRTTGRLLPPGIFARSYPGVPGRIHLDDPMLPVDSPRELRHYIADAQSAIANIDESLHVTGRSFAGVKACLDLPSGYGRVTRFLREKIASGHITACDIDGEAIRFCAREFRVKALLSRRDIRAVSFPERYDLIFVGSLLTHLPEVDCLRTLDALVDVLDPRRNMPEPLELVRDRVRGSGRAFSTGRDTPRRLLRAVPQEEGLRHHHPREVVHRRRDGAALSGNAEVRTIQGTGLGRTSGHVVVLSTLRRPRLRRPASWV